MWKEIFSFILSLLALLTSLLFLISLPGVSTSSKTLKELSWLSAKSDGSILGIGNIYAGTNAFFINGIDHDVLKYIDCTDLLDLCDSCSKISTTVTFVLIICFLFSLITLFLSFATICYETNDNRRSVTSIITFILSIVVYTSFDDCYNGFKSSPGLTNDVQIERGFQCILYGLITSGVLGTFSVAAKVFENSKLSPTRSKTVYATNEEFEFEDIKNDEEFQANLD